MKLEGRNLRVNMRGEDVSVLQRALRRLDFEILGNVDHDHTRAAEVLIKSNIEPEFFDLKEKQLLESAEFYAGTLKRVAALTGNIISVIVDPRKWINITSLVETFGDSLEHIFNHYKNHRSKEYRAMQFIGMLKSATKSRRDKTGRTV